MNNGNWFAVSRTIFDHHLVGIKDRPYTEMEAWLWLIAEAEFETSPVINKGQRIVLDPGQMMAAHGYLAKRWQWTVDKVRWFLKRLQNEAMVTRYCTTQNAGRNTNQIQIITICNYSDYQFTGEAKPQPTQQPEHQPSPKPTPSQHQEYKDNTLTPKHKIPPSPPMGGDAILARFEEWWGIYPNSARKVAKGECLSLFRQAVTGKRNPSKKGAQKILEHGLATADQLLIAVKRYVATRPDPDYVPAPATWLNQGRWLDGNGSSVSAPLWWQDATKVARVTPDQWRGSIAKNANGHWPVEKLGPCPGMDDCRVPDDIISELRLLERYDENGVERISWRAKNDRR